MLTAQVELQSGKAKLVTWVPYDIRLEVGLEITLDDGKRWKISEIYRLSVLEGQELEDHATI